MKVKDIKVNQVFNIEHTPSYPKLKTKEGYIDIRDNIVNNDGNCNNLEAEIMSLELLSQKYFDTIEGVKKWIKTQTGMQV